MLEIEKNAILENSHLFEYILIWVLTLWPEKNSISFYGFIELKFWKIP